MGWAWVAVDLAWACKARARWAPTYRVGLATRHQPAPAVVLDHSGQANADSTATTLMRGDRASSRPPPFVQATFYRVDYPVSLLYAMDPLLFEWHCL